MFLRLRRGWDSGWRGIKCYNRMYVVRWLCCRRPIRWGWGVRCHGRELGREHCYGLAMGLQNYNNSAEVTHRQTMEQCRSARQLSSPQVIHVTPKS